MEWFGKHWGAPVCETAKHTETPVGLKCGKCDRVIELDDDGFLLPLGVEVEDDPNLDLLLLKDGTVRWIAYHRACFLRLVLPSKAPEPKWVNCPECGGDGADLEDSSKACWECAGKGEIGCSCPDPSCPAHSSFAGLSRA